MFQNRAGSSFGVWLRILAATNTASPSRDRNEGESERFNGRESDVDMTMSEEEEEEHGERHSTEFHRMGNRRA